MNITPKQEEYIKQNIDLINKERWETFFKEAPPGIGTILYISGIDFMKQMKEIPRECFTKSPLNKITIPDNITSIGQSAFFSCENLTSINIPDSVTSIGKYAFLYSGLTSVIIPDSVRSIHEGTFSNCDSLKSIMIPNSVTSIDTDAFRECRNKLHIEYDGTQEEWEYILSRNAFKKTRYECICTDGVVNKARG